MSLKIVTDSTSDITKEIADKYGITVVPLTVSFGRDSFTDRVTISTDEFYNRLSYDPLWPTTTQPSPGAFADVYTKLAEGNNEILVITISHKLSGTYDSALNARSLVNKNIKIEVIDTETVVMGEGLLAITAAKAAQAGADLATVSEIIKQSVPKSHAIMYFDTMKYLVKGGRIGKAKGLVGSLLSVKPILTMKDGEVSPLSRVRSRAAGLDYLYNFVAGFKNIKELAVEHATTAGEVEKLIDRLKALYPPEKVFRSTVSPVIGTYAGPGILSVTVLEA